MVSIPAFHSTSCCTWTHLAFWYFSILQSAIFDFSSLITVILLLICACTYLRSYRPAIFDNATEPHRHTGFRGLCWKLSRIGERISPYVSIACLMMAVHVLFINDWLHHSTLLFFFECISTCFFMCNLTASTSYFSNWQFFWIWEFNLWIICAGVLCLILQGLRVCDAPYLILKVMRVLDNVELCALEADFLSSPAEIFLRWHSIQRHHTMEKYWHHLL